MTNVLIHNLQRQEIMSPIQQAMLGENNQHRSKAAYNTYFETSRDALLLVSNHGAILQSNERFARLSLYSIANQNFIDLFCQTDEPTPLFPLHRKMRSRPLLSLTTRMRQKTGTQKPIEIFICPVHLNDKNLNTYQILVKKILGPR